MRPIDADALLTWFNNHYDDEEVTVGYVSGLIKEQPTIDAAPKRGTWELIREEDNGDVFYRCTACGAGDIHHPDVKVPYCWKCGARMDAGEDE